MILVADSGSTKTDWLIIDGSDQIAFSTLGFNPLFSDIDEIVEEIVFNFPKQMNTDDIEKVYFYGPGCNTEERCLFMQNPLQSVFKTAKIQVHSDLLGAARSLFQKEKGIACILGTGSNSGVYNGEIISENIRSLGYILGDEGSGAHLGLAFLKLILNEEVSLKLREDFQQQFKLSTDEIIEKVYREAFPNRFLASFVPFIHQNIGDLKIHKMVKESFESFVERHILPYQNWDKKKIAFVGSVAFYFQEIIENIAKEKGIKIFQILQSPIQNLALYHSNF